MKKWLVVLIAVMALCLAVGSALAAGETLPDWRSVENPRIAIKGETVSISTGIGTGYEAIKLVVKDTSDWGTKRAEIQNVSNAVNGKLSFSIDTSAAEFEAGHLYTTELFAIPTGKTENPEKWEGYWDSVLTVVPTGVTGLQIYMNKTQMETGYNGYFVTAYDPNATNVWIVLDGEAYQSRPGNNITWVNGYGEPGTHKVSAISMNAEGVKTTADEKTFSVVQNDDPTLYAQNVTPVTFTMGNETKSLDEFPETITAGTDISYTIHRVTKDLGLDAQNQEQQVWYDSWLDDFTDGDGSLELPCFEQRYEQEVAHGELMNAKTGYQTVTIDHSKLITGHTYQLNVEIRSAGRSTVWYSKTFVVLPENMNNQGITLSFTGNDAGKSSVNYPVFDDFTLHASTPGATLVRFWAADHFEYLNHRTGRIGQEEFDIEWKTWWTSEFKYFVQAYYGEIGETPWDELDWDAARTSNILTVKAVRDDNVQSIRPTFGQLSDTVKQGEYFTVSITNADELDSAGIYVGANLYNGNDIDNHYDRTGNKILVPTIDLEPGYYILGIYTETTGGDYLADQHCFRVVAPDVQPENNFMITTTAPKVDGKYTVQSYEEFSVSFYAPDKEGYNKYYRFNDGQGWWRDNWFERSMTLDVELDPGIWEIYAEVVYEPENGNGEELRYESEHIQITATSLGDSGIMLDAPGSYMVGGNGYTVSIKNSKTDEPEPINPEQYNEEYWEVILEEVNGPGHMEFRRDNGDQLQSSFTFPDDQFTAGKTYKVRLHLNVPGYDSADDEVCFAAVNPEEVDQSKLELVVTEYNTGSDVSLIQAHTNVNVKVNKSDDITAVRVLNGDNWEIWNGNDSYERDWSFGYGIYGIVAQGTTQEPVWEEEGFDWDDFDWDKDVNWTVTSNTVTIRFNAPKGKLGMPTLSLDKDEYTRGEIITATVGKVFGTEWYDLKAIPIDENGNEDWSRKTELHMDMDGSGEGTFNFAIQTAHMEPGTYRIWVDNNGTGYNGNGSPRIEVEIKAGSQAPTAVLDIPATISTNTNVPVYAYVPGADWIWVEIRKEGDPGWRNEFNDSQGQNAWTWEFGEAFKGTYLFTLYGKADGEDVKAVGPVSVEVTAPNGELNDAEFTDINTKTITIGSGAASSGVSGNFTKDSRAEWYQVRLVYRGPNGDWGDDEIKNDFRDGENIGTSFTYDKTDFRRGAGVYEVQVIGGATGYNGKHNSIRILALEATTDEPIELEIRKDDGTTGSSLSVQANENFTIRVHAPEATAIRMYDGERWHWWDGRCLNDNGLAEFGWSLNSGNYLFIAQAAYDEGYDWKNFNDWEHFDSNKDLHWTATSNQVSVSVSASGETDQPVIAKIGKVTRGELLKVTVTSAGAEDSEKRATSVDASIRNEDGWNIGEGIVSGQLEAKDYPYTFQFPTGDLEAGSYYVYVYGHALRYNTTEACMEFEVTEPENGAFIFEIPEELVSQRDFSMSAYAEGAYQIDVNFHQIDREDEFTMNFEGDHIYNTRANLNAGLYEIQAVAHYQDEAGNETGTKTSDTIRREVIWLGQLAGPEIVAQSSYPVSEGGVFTVSNLGQGSYWWVEIYDTDLLEENEDGVWKRVARWDPNTGMPEDGFPISTEYLTAGHSYRINAGVMQEGFEDGTGWKSFVAVGTSSGNVTLSVEVPDGYSLDHWPSSKNIHMTINAPGSSAIRIWNDNNWDCRDSRGMDEDGDYYVDFNYNDVGKYTLVAQASYDKNPDGSDIDWDNVDFSEFDWSSMTWTDMSNAVLVTVVADGQVGEPTFTAPDAVKTGDDIEITITNRQQDQWYNAAIQDQDGWDVIRQFDMVEDKPDTIRISTENIDPGQYQLIVWTDTEGKLGQEARSSIVIDDLRNAAVFTLPAGIAEVEPDAFDGVHMDAVVIQGNHQELDLSFLNGTGARYLVANEGSITIPNYHSYAVITPEQFNILK